jgi:hypothetical protein
MTSTSPATTARIRRLRSGRLEEVVVGGVVVRNMGQEAGKAIMGGMGTLVELPAASMLQL